MMVVLILLLDSLLCVWFIDFVCLKGLMCMW